MAKPSRRRKWLTACLGAFLAGVFLCYASVAQTFPRRIISLTPSTTEMLFAIGAGSQVAGVTTADNYPPAARNLPKVGGVNLDEEKIVALKPDLVVGEEDLVAAQLLSLKRLGLKVLGVRTRTLEEIPHTLRLLGEATGHPVEAEMLAVKFQDGVRQIVSATSKNKLRPRVFIELGSRPLLTTGKGTYLDDLVRDAGGANIGRSLPSGFRIISPEEVVAKNPEVIIAADGERWKDIAARPGWGVVSAVARKRVYSIDPDLIMRPGPRVLWGLKMMAAWLHPRSRL